jgi:polysaccharide export outer membrane protein
MASLTKVLVIIALTIAAGTLVGQDDRTAPVDNTAQASAAPPAAPGGESGTHVPALQERNPRYLLCKGDAIELNFPFTPEFNQTLTVQPDGYVTLLGVGDIHVEGESVPQLKQVFKDAYTGILDDPVFTIVLKDFAKPYFTASGQLNKPGKYDLREDTTALEAVAIAGGFNDSAKHSQVILFRRVSKDWVEARELDMKKMLKNKDISEVVHLQPGDMIFVPKNTISKMSRFLPTANMGVMVSPAPAF